MPGVVFVIAVAVTDWFVYTSLAPFAGRPD